MPPHGGLFHYRNGSAGGDHSNAFKELQSSIFSACLHTSRPLQIHVFLAPEDMAPGKSGLQRCNLCWMAATCIAGHRHGVRQRAGSNESGGGGTTTSPAEVEVPAARIVVHSLNATVLRWFMDELGVVGYGHHSTWYGYSKLWLPRLLPNEEWAAFVDTDTIFLKDPWQLLDIRLQMSEAQTIAAARILGNPPTWASLGFTHRINSGLMVLALGRLRAAGWGKVLKETIDANRGWSVGTEIEKGEQVCEDFHWGEFNASTCVTSPCNAAQPVGNCLNFGIRAALEDGRFCPGVGGGVEIDMAGKGGGFSRFSAGDQEVFSAMLSNSVGGGNRSHWLYVLNNMTKHPTSGPAIHHHSTNGEQCAADCTNWRDDGTLLYHHACIATLQNPSARQNSKSVAGAFAKLVSLTEVGPAAAAAAASASSADAAFAAPRFDPTPAFERGYDSLSRCARTSAMGLLHLPWGAAALEKLLAEVKTGGSCRQCAQESAFDWDSYR